MSENDAIKKLIMDLASQVALDEHLDTVRFNMRPPEFPSMDCISVIFYKGNWAVSNLFPISEFLDKKTDLCKLAITSCLKEMANKLRG